MFFIFKVILTTKVMNIHFSIFLSKYAIFFAFYIYIFTRLEFIFVYIVR